MTHSINVASYLASLARTDPERAAVIVARTGRTRSFRELHEASDALAHGLMKAGITRGSRVAVMVPPSVEFFTLTFALFKAAAVPVMIDPGMGVNNVGECLKEAEPAAFIGIPKAHVARRLFGWAKGAITVNAGRRRFFCRHSTASLSTHRGPFEPPAVTPDETAAILFTSGSTGLAKGAVYTHGIFAAQVEMLKTIYGIKAGEIDLCTFPLFALFGPALGMSCVIPTMNFSRPATIDAAKTVDAIEKHGVTNLFGSPAVIRRLEEYGRPLPSLQRAISAGAPATMKVVESFAKLLTDAQLYTPYGATESLPVANIGSDELLSTKAMTEAGHGICVGKPVPGVRVHVIPITDDAVPVFDPSQCLKPGEIGELVVRGPIVTKSYWRREEATKLAKMTDTATGETLHRIGDVGYVDDHDRLWFCGRKNHRVVTEHVTLFTDQIEPVFNTVEGVFRTALVGVGQKIKQPVICVERISMRNMPRDRKYRLHYIPWEEMMDQLKKKAQSHAITSCITQFLEYSWLFPLDVRHNSKINREALAVWAAKQLRKTKS